MCCAVISIKSTNWRKISAMTLQGNQSHSRMLHWMDVSFVVGKAFGFKQYAS